MAEHAFQIQLDVTADTSAFDRKVAESLAKVGGSVNVPVPGGAATPTGADRFSAAEVSSVNSALAAAQSRSERAVEEIRGNIHGGSFPSQAYVNQQIANATFPQSVAVPGSAYSARMTMSPAQMSSTFGVQIQPPPPPPPPPSAAVAAGNASFSQQVANLQNSLFGGARAAVANMAAGAPTGLPPATTAIPPGTTPAGTTPAQAAPGAVVPGAGGMPVVVAPGRQRRPRVPAPGRPSRQTFGLPTNTLRGLAGLAGTSEVYNAYQAERLAGVRASIAESPEEAAEALQAGLDQQTSGFFGSIAGGLMDIFSAGNGPTDLRIELIAESARSRQQKQARQIDFETRNRAAVRTAPGGDFGRALAIVDADRNAAIREIQKANSDLQAKGPAAPRPFWRRFVFGDLDPLAAIPEDPNSPGALARRDVISSRLKQATEEEAQATEKRTQIQRDRRIEVGLYAADRESAGRATRYDIAGTRGRAANIGIRSNFASESNASELAFQEKQRTADLELRDQYNRWQVHVANRPNEAATIAMGQAFQQSAASLPARMAAAQTMRDAEQADVERRRKLDLTDIVGSFPALLSAAAGRFGRAAEQDFIAGLAQERATADQDPQIQINLRASQALRRQARRVQQEAAIRARDEGTASSEMRRGGKPYLAALKDLGSDFEQELADSRTPEDEESIRQKYSERRAALTQQFAEHQFENRQLLTGAIRQSRLRQGGRRTEAALDEIVQAAGRDARALDKEGDSVGAIKRRTLGVEQIREAEDNYYRAFQFQEVLGGNIAASRRGGFEGIADKFRKAEDQIGKSKEGGKGDDSLKNIEELLRQFLTKNFIARAT